MSSDFTPDELTEIERLARVLIEARDEYKTLVASPESLSADIKRAVRCCIQASAAFTDEATPERILSLVSQARAADEIKRDEKLHDALTHALGAKVKAQEKLLVAYRTGSRRVSESALDAMEKADEMLTAAHEAAKAESARRVSLLPGEPAT